MFEGILAELVGTLDALADAHDDPRVARSLELGNALLDALGMLNSAHQSDSTTEAFWARWEKAVLADDYDEETFIRAWAALQKRTGRPCFGDGMIVEGWDEWVDLVLNMQPPAAPDIPEEPEPPPLPEPPEKELGDWDL
jgi:hypothetical protein